MLIDTALQTGDNQRALKGEGLRRVWLTACDGWRHTTQSCGCVPIDLDTWTEFNGWCHAEERGSVQTRSFSCRQQSAALQTNAHESLPPSLTCPLRAERPSSPTWDLSSPPPSAQSNPVDRPPAHQLHLHWLAINQRHWHSRASVCGPRADVYSTTQGPGPHASHRDYIIYCIRRGVGSLWRKKGNGTKNKKKICLGARWSVTLLIHT